MAEEIIFIVNRCYFFCKQLNSWEAHLVFSEKSEGATFFRRRDRERRPCNAPTDGGDCPLRHLWMEILSPSKACTSRARSSRIFQKRGQFINFTDSVAILL